jgi:hypothetical protein
MNNDDGETVAPDDSNMDYVEQKIKRLKSALKAIASNEHTVFECVEIANAALAQEEF